MIKTAPAKTNLILKVISKKQTTTKHEIDSIVVLVKNKFDIVFMKKSHKPSVTYKYHGGDLTINDCNITKAMKYLKDKFNVSIDYSVRVCKRIPISSGMGGSSTTAAVVMKKILKDNKINVKDLNMLEIALKLGSDIPFFLSGFRCARVTGCGEVVVETKKPKVKFKLFTPSFPMSTEKVYTSLAQDKNYVSKVDVDKLYKIMLEGTIEPRATYNDLEAYALRDKDFQNTFEHMTRKHKKVFLSGSGSSIIIVK